jgi:GNAT superfamily N-acetyltransferase
MWFRLTGAEFRAGAGDANRAALRRLVDTGAPTGLLAYRDGVPVGWCAVAPRRDQPRLARSPLVRAAEARRPALEPVWAVTCLYLPPAHRGQGVARALVRAAVDHARSAGARTIEAYPLDPGVRVVGVDAAYVGLLPLFADLGFQEVVRPWPARLVVRLRSG